MNDSRKNAISDFLLSFDLDLEDPDLQRTPERVANLYTDLFSSLGQLPPSLSSFRTEDNDIVIIQDLKFHSICIHHLVPFFGSVDIAYRPNKKVAGFGGFNRLVEYVSKKPQLQERMTNELGDLIQDALEPAGLWIRCRARQLCVELRQGSDATYTTVSTHGEFKSADIQKDILKLIQ